MPQPPHVDRSFVSPDFVEPGPGGSLPDIEGVHELTTSSLSEMLEFSIVNQWSGGEGMYRVGVSVQDADAQPLAIAVGDEAVLRHTVAYDFRPDRPPLRQYLQVEMHPRAWGEVFVCLDVNGIEVYRYPFEIVKAE